VLGARKESNNNVLGKRKAKLAAQKWGRGNKRTITRILSSSGDRWPSTGKAGLA